MPASPKGWRVLGNEFLERGVGTICGYIFHDGMGSDVLEREPLPHYPRPSGGAAAAGWRV
jgi:hypothetical protein